MFDWAQCREQLTGKIGDLGKLSPDTLSSYMALSEAAGKTSLLDTKTRELISLALAVTTRCDGCIAFHAESAAKHGATREELAEVLSVAVAMNAGAALVYSARALDAFDAQS